MRQNYGNNFHTKNQILHQDQNDFHQLNKKFHQLLGTGFKNEKVVPGQSRWGMFKI